MTLTCLSVFTWLSHPDPFLLGSSRRASEEAEPLPGAEVGHGHDVVERQLARSLDVCFLEQP